MPDFAFPSALIRLPGIGDSHDSARRRVIMQAPASLSHNRLKPPLSQGMVPMRLVVDPRHLDTKKMLEG
jgi:hypothetical protein